MEVTSRVRHAVGMLGQRLLWTMVAIVAVPTMIAVAFVALRGLDDSGLYDQY